MILFTVLLLLSGIWKAAADTHAFWWKSSIFFSRKEATTKIGKWWQWFTAKDASNNKYRFSNPILSWLFQGPLVATTDVWHFSNFLFYTTYQVIIASCIAADFWGILFYVGVMKFIQGVAFELGRVLLSRDAYVEARHIRRTFTSILIVYSRGIAIGLFATCFLIGLHIASRGLYTDEWVPRYTAALLITIFGAAAGGWVLWFGGNRK